MRRTWLAQSWFCIAAKPEDTGKFELEETHGVKSRTFEIKHIIGMLRFMVREMSKAVMTDVSYMYDLWTFPEAPERRTFTKAEFRNSVFKYP